MEQREFGRLFERHPGNPIISAHDLPYPAHAVFNAGAAKVGDEYLLLLRVEDKRGLSHLTVARSPDGVRTWKIDEKPSMMPCPDEHPEEVYGIEDPRITYLEERGVWAVAYTSFSEGGPLVSLALTEDFKEFDRHGPVLPPEDKDAALFPARIKGRWAMVHRPVTVYPGTGAHIWISFSPDLRHWGDHRILLPARRGAWWDANKVGLSPPPLRTDEGWLMLYHGVRTTASGVIYRLGLALLDLEDPLKVIARSDEWIFAPETHYELLGDVDKVVFPCGWIREGDEILLYYGGADTCVGLATAKLSDLLGWLKHYGSRKGNMSCA